MRSQVSQRAFADEGIDLSELQAHHASEAGSCAV